MNPNAIKDRDVLVHAGPGAGKTFGALLTFQAMQREGLLKNFLVFCHRNSILNQWKQSAKELNLQLENVEYYNNQKQLPKEPDGWIVSYQSASKNFPSLNNLFRSYKDLMAIADEAHHLGVDPEEPEGPIWGKTFLDLTKNSKIRLGLTGTPFRSDNLAFCSARKVRIETNGVLIEQINPDLCIAPNELISEGDVRPLEFHFQDGWVEHNSKNKTTNEISSISSEERESWRARNLRRAISLSDSSSIAVQLLLRARKKLELVRNEHKNAGGLVIAKDIEHAISISTLLKENGDSVEVVHSQDPTSNNRLEHFESSNTKWLVSVDMCSEGFDSPRLRVVAYLTNVVTRTRFLQGITRAVRISKERSSKEPIPRNYSFIFAPADPLLMQYARGWSKAEPYLIRGNESVGSISNYPETFRGPILPLEAVKDNAGKLIRMRPAQLPNFIKR